MVDAEVEEEAADGGDDEEGRDGEALEAEGGDGVYGAEEEAEGVEEGDEAVVEDGSERHADDSEAAAEGPAHGGTEGTGGDGEERLVDGVYVDVVDLVDSYDVAVAAEEGNEAHEGAGEEAPVDEVGVLEEGLGDEGGSAEERASDGVWASELPGRVDEVADVELLRSVILRRCAT